MSTGMGAVTGLGRLTRLGLRRDRLLVAAWVLVLVAISYASAAATPSLYSTTAQQVAAAESIDATPAVVALYGPILDVRSLGELSMTKMTVLYTVFVAVLVVVVVRRHTRSEEESGRAELLGGTAVGSNALLAAALGEGAVVSLMVGFLAGLSTVAGGLPVAGSFAFGLSWSGIGLVSAGLAAVCCQLSASARTCSAVAAAALGALFVLRAVGDTSTQSWLSWSSPFGWSTQLRAWSGPRWWVLLLYVVAAAALGAAAHLLRSHRDLGSGLLDDRLGPARGTSRLKSAVALAWRQQAAALVTWSVTLAALGLVLGAIAPGIGSLLDSPGARDLIARLGGTGALHDSLLTAVLSVVAVVVTCFAVGVVGHGGDDEHDGRTEQVLATATPRAQVFLASLVVAVVGSTLLLLVTGSAVALGARDVDVLAATLVQAPAVWLVTALAVAAYALRGGWSTAGWGLVALFVTLGQLGELLHLPQSVIDLSPYVHVPRMPVKSFAAEPVSVMTVLAAAVLGLSWLAYRRRDIGP